MVKENLKSKIKRWIFSHPWLKFIALVLAIMVWLYIKGEILRFNY